MGIRFKKTIKVLPGVHLNVSKSGVSTTIGPKGAKVNVGKNGVYVSTGIPGTGIYMREKVSGSPKEGSTGKMQDNEFKRKYELYQPLHLRIDNTGNVLVIDKNGDDINDDVFLKRLAATNSYRELKEKMIQQWREKKDLE